MTASPSDDATGDKVTRPKHLLRPLMWLIVAAAVTYSGYGLFTSLKKSSGELEIGLSSIVPLMLGLLTMTLAIALQGVAWIALMDHLTGTRVLRCAALVIYLDSQMARYTPGKVGLPLVRIAGAKTLGISGRLTGASVLIEMLSWISVGGAVALSLLAWNSMHLGLGENVGRALPVLAALAFGGLLVLTLLDRQRLPSWVGRALHLEGNGALMPMRLPAIHLVYWLAWAAHGYCLSWAFGAPPSAALASAGVYVLAPLVGFLALVAPAGAGVREAVLLGLAPVLGVKAALGAAVASRVMSFLADVVVWFVVRAVVRRRS